MATGNAAAGSARSMKAKSSYRISSSHFKDRLTQTSWTKPHYSCVVESIGFIEIFTTTHVTYNLRDSYKRDEIRKRNTRKYLWHYVFMFRA